MHNNPKQCIFFFLCSIVLCELWLPPLSSIFCESSPSSSPSQYPQVSSQWMDIKICTHVTRVTYCGVKRPLVQIARTPMMTKVTVMVSKEEFYILPSLYKCGRILRHWHLKTNYTVGNEKSVELLAISKK